MGAQVIAEQERIALVGPALDTHMGMGPALTEGSTKEQFLPLGIRPRKMRRAVIAMNLFVGCIPDRGHRCDQGIIEGRDGDLNVDHIFGGQAGHGGRADVINAQGEITQGATQDGGDLLKTRAASLVGRERFRAWAGRSCEHRKTNLTAKSAKNAK